MSLQFCCLEINTLKITNVCISDSDSQDWTNKTKYPSSVSVGSKITL